MLKEITSSATRIISVEPNNVSLALTDNELVPFYLSLPPLEEFKKLKEIAEEHVSISEIVEEAQNDLRIFYQVELDKLKAKEERFKDSSTFQSHLASLSELSGDYPQAESYLRNAISDNPGETFFIHKLGSNLIHQNNLAEAESFISNNLIESDVFSRLQLAYTAILHAKYDHALELVDHAINIDPLDFDARLLAGALYVYRSNFEQAIRHFRLALETKPYSASVYINLAISQYALGELDKAVRSSHRAVALSPLNRNAVMLFSDLTLQLNRSEASIPALKKYLRYEEKSHDIWSRLARAYYINDQLADAHTALRNEAALNESASVWNNLGVVCWKRGNLRRAIQWFSHAVNKEIDEHPNEAALPLSNLAVLLAENKRFKELVSAGQPLIDKPLIRNLISLNTSSGFFVNYLNSLYQIGKHKDAIHLAEELLSEGSSADEVRVGITALLISIYSLNDPNRDEAIRYCTWALELLNACPSCETDIRTALINNIAFALIEFGEFDKVKEILNELSRSVHKDSYSTATLGLFHLRRGNLERGKSLYMEAIQLAIKQESKTYIRQKMNLELGTVYLDMNDKKSAVRFLKKAIEKPSLGHASITQKAKSVLRTITA